MHRQGAYLSGAALALFAIAAFVYFPGLNGPFVFDDLTNIIQVSGIRITDLSIDSIKQALLAREYDTFIGRPLAMLTFALNYYFTQFDPYYFKVTNVGIHLATGVAIYVLTLRLLRRHQAATTNCTYRSDHLPWLALAVTALWLLHPLSLTSVLYVVQRMTSLSTLFMLLALIGYCLGREQLIAGKRFGLATAFVSLFLFGGVATLFKENGVLVLPLAVIVEVAFYRFATHSALQTLFRRTWLLAIALPLILAGITLLLQYERWFGAEAYRFRDFTLEERLLTQARAIWFYLRLIFLPDIAKMGLYHDDFPVSTGLLQPWSTLPAVLGIIGLASIAWLTRNRAPILFFAIAWFLVGHSMESSVLPLEMVHEHRNYLPQYSVLFAVAYHTTALYAHPAVQRTLRLRIIFVVLYAGLLGVATYSRSLQWKDEETLFTREVVNHPESARAHTMLGAWMHAAGFSDFALRHLTIATNLTPNQAEHLIRLVQHVYTASQSVPDVLLDELQNRLSQNRISGVTLWVYEPLLRVTRNDQKLHDRIIDIYAMAVSRTDIRLPNNWYEAAYKHLGENHEHRRRPRVAIQYYEKARALNPRPAYDIAIADVYAKNGCPDRSRVLVAALKAQNLTTRDIARLETVEALLAKRDSPARCKL